MGWSVKVVMGWPVECKSISWREGSVLFRVNMVRNHVFYSGFVLPTLRNPGWSSLLMVSLTTRYPHSSSSCTTTPTH